LKGGAPAQLYLPIEEQRASVDVEQAYPPKAGAPDKACPS